MADWTYTESDGNATLTNYTGASTSITIPTTIDGYPVVAIGANACSGKSLTSVTINHNIDLNQNSFYNNSGIEVILNSNVTTNSTGGSFNNVFYGCNIGSGLTIASGVTNIPESLFAYAGLTSVTFPSTLTSIAKYAFKQNLLTSITLSSVETIGELAFGSNALTSLTLPSSLVSIGDAAFCENFIESLIINNPITIGESCFSDNIGIKVTLNANVTYLYDEYYYGCFENCEIAGNLIIGTSCTIIPPAFFAYAGLTEVILHDGVISVGDYCFKQNDDLAKLYVYNYNTAFRTDVLSGIEPDGKYTIYGYSGSTAETLATAYSTYFNFVSLASSIDIVSEIRTVLIDGKYVLIKSDWSFDNSINSQSPMSCTCINPSFKIVKGHEFIFKIDGITKYAGIVTDVEIEEIAPTVLNYSLEINDWTWLTDKRLVGEKFESKSAGYIFKFIITNYLADEGITQGVIQSGAIFDKVFFNFETATKCFNTMQESSPGYNWIIDVNKKIHFVSKSTYTSTQVINNSFLCKNFKYRDAYNGYTNYIVLEGGRRKTELIESYIATPVPDGVNNKEFTVKYPLANEPVVRVYTDDTTYTTPTVGINGLATGKGCYWTYGSDKISFEAAPVGVAIKVTFYGLVDIKMVIEDTARIEERSSIETGTSGRYDTLFVNKDITTNSAAAQYANGLIEKYSNQSTIEFDLYGNIGDIEINKLIKVEKELFGIDDWYLVESISGSYFKTTDIKYHVKLIGGEHVGNWVDYFKKLLPQVKDINIDSGTFTKLKLLNEKWKFDSYTNITRALPIYCSDGIIPAEDMIPLYCDDTTLVDTTTLVDGGIVSNNGALYCSEDLTCGGDLIGAGSDILYCNEIVLCGESISCGSSNAEVIYG